jgi:hypothetical protein
LQVKLKRYRTRWFAFTKHRACSTPHNPVHLQRNEKEISVCIDSTSETVTVAATTERDSTDLDNVKLRNLDYHRFSTGRRGGVDDLIQLTHLHEPAILDVLVCRAFAHMLEHGICRFASLHSTQRLLCIAGSSIRQRLYLHVYWSYFAGSQPISTFAPVLQAGKCEWLNEVLSFPLASASRRGIFVGLYSYLPPCRPLKSFTPKVSCVVRV